MPGKLLDLQRYPVDRLSSPEGERLLTACQSEFGMNGACLLPGFVTPAGVELMLEEARARLPRAFFCHKSHNAYLLDDDPSFDEDHPRRRQLETQVGSIACDDLPAEGVLRRFYAWDPLTRVIGAVLGQESFYRIADPLGAASVNVFEHGAAHAWHFDESLFSVTLMLQTAERGGGFEYVPNVRTPDDDAYQKVGRILDGDRSAVEQAPFEPGTLFIFAGRNSLHRVTRVEGDRPRLVPVLCYDTKPGSINSDEVRTLFWGRTEARS